MISFPTGDSKSIKQKSLDQQRSTAHLSGLAVQLLAVLLGLRWKQNHRFVISSLNDSIRSLTGTNSSDLIFKAKSKGFSAGEGMKMEMFMLTCHQNLECQTSDFIK
ncbi:hypothetical protein XENORESO_013901 [Xenotaenia resolanae]|uniref:Uncharacterized protein n=1 Tax=Xenotaenia resolanae TaxID=208358 RepID=A0ABV0W2U4_9TELE